jgi:hypothetical protein
MMSDSSERPERLAEILREIIALSNPTRMNDSGSLRTDDSIELIDPQGVNGIDQTGASSRKKARQEGSKSKDRYRRCEQ